MANDLERVVKVLSKQDVRLQRLETQEIGVGGTAASGTSADASINFVFQRGGEVLNTDLVMEARVFFDGTISRWSVVADQSGTIRFNVAKSTYASYASMTNIDGSDPPELGTAIKAESTSLTGWTTSISSGDVFRVSVDNAVTPTNVTRATVTLQSSAS